MVLESSCLLVQRVWRGVLGRHFFEKLRYAHCWAATLRGAHVYTARTIEKDNLLQCLSGMLRHDSELERFERSMREATMSMSDIYFVAQHAHADALFRNEEPRAAKLRRLLIEAGTQIVASRAGDESL